MAGITSLERSIFDTVRYFDIFNMPVTATQIWRSLIVDRTGTGIRWQGRQAVPLRLVMETLRQSDWLSRTLEEYWGYWGLKKEEWPGRGLSWRVRRRLARHILAQQKWRKARAVVRRLTYLPLVRMMGVTGSLSMWHARAQSDFDLLVVVRRGRIWTARLLLLLAAQVMGRRRKYWEGEAPDRLCLNHYLTDDQLSIASNARSLYTAMLYSHLVPLWGMDVYDSWLKANRAWMRRWLMYPVAPTLPSRQAVRAAGLARAVRRWLEGLLLEPAGGLLEKTAERVQRRVINRHQQYSGGGRVMVSSQELAFHPYSQERKVLEKFAQEYGQGRLF